MNNLYKSIVSIFLVFSSLFGQWALWNNPSLPVGESDKGFGAGKGQTYYTIQTSVAFIDWWHEPVDAEPFDHKGILGTYFIRPGFVHGLTNNLNLSFATLQPVQVACIPMVFPCFRTILKLPNGWRLEAVFKRVHCLFMITLALVDNLCLWPLRNMSGLSSVEFLRL